MQTRRTIYEKADGAGGQIMSCRFNEYVGKCMFFGDGIERPYDDNGHCLCEDDENPENACEDYQE